jgi:hypothetical protein
MDRDELNGRIQRDVAEHVERELRKFRSTELDWMAVMQFRLAKSDDERARIIQRALARWVENLVGQQKKIDKELGG